MTNIIKQEILWGGRKLVLETGKIARQADGAVLATYGETIVLCTAVAVKKSAPNADFFPLTVHYQEKAFAAGRIPGGFFKREAKPSEKETLISRLIDRPIRPLFPENFFNEVQLIATVLSYDCENDADIVAIIGCSAALALSGAPFLGPIGAAKVGYSNGEYILNPTLKQLETNDLDLVVAGTNSGVLMVESQASELNETIMLGAVKFGHESYQPVIQMINELASKAEQKNWFVPQENVLQQQVMDKVTEFAEKDLTQAYKITQKQIRYGTIEEIKNATCTALSESFDEATIDSAFKKIQAKILRKDILNNQHRVDNRTLTEIRPISSEVGILPRVHGSALFTRGETQALVVVTLGTSQDEQLIDGLFGEYKERFLLHYNFPPYSVGETGRMSSPGRREIGHGKLAWRSIYPILPSKSEFPYTIRIVSEITESNGSSSMATVCGSSLALMDAGVPLEKPIAGIAMGLIKEDEKFAVLSDILGDEDHLGDMDFKVAGTKDGITALQMDIKITSITPEIMEIALAQAKDGRLHILNEMSKTINQSNNGLSQHAPRLMQIKIHKDKIRDVIGTGGKIIREICELSGAKIDIDETGNITIAAVNTDSLDKAISMINNITAEPEIGQIYAGKVVKIMEFGAIVVFMGNKDGMVHISEISPQRVANINDILKVGDNVSVKVTGFEGNRIKLSIKAALEPVPTIGKSKKKQ